MAEIIYTTTYREREHSEPVFCRLDYGHPRFALEEIGKKIKWNCPDAETYTERTTDGFRITVRYTNEDGERVESYYDITEKLV